MGGRGSLGGTRSTYRGESTTLFRQRQAQGVDTAGSGGGGGGSSKNKGSGNAGAGTGGIEGGGGSAGGLGGGGSTVETKPTETDQTTDTDSSTASDINEQDFATLTDEQLVELFEQSDEFEQFEDKMAGSTSSAGAQGRADNYDKLYNRAYTKWLQSKGEVEPPPATLEFNFGPNVSPFEKTGKIAQLDAIPSRIRQVMFERGLKINAAGRADESDAWDSFANPRNYTSTSTIADGREVGSLSFYDQITNQIFISVRNPGSSKNVIAHEVGHGIDAKWNEAEVDVIWTDDQGVDQIYQVKTISREDPDFIFLHDNFVKDNTEIDSYYRGGPGGSNDEEGRSELFAESFAAYVRGGRLGLVGFLAAIPNGEDDNGPKNRDYVIDTIIGIWHRYGILE